MKRLLHILATPRGEDSRTLKVSRTFLEACRKKHNELIIDEINVSTEALPDLTYRTIQGKYALLSGKDLDQGQMQNWTKVIDLIERFKSADCYLVSTPMWNFGLPYTLKHFIDVILQPRYTFRYTEKGPEGLVTGKKMLIVTSRGGDYGPESPLHSMDMLEPYLCQAFNFIGITDITFINAQPMDALGPEVQKEKIQQAQELARKLAEKF
ncbi:MAG: NAD(P)H-dependent oxidoreductase [Candidatus Wallbacteria bacterium]|nr:NAD(P)H-dependent oxidoreductase [Candidatus Wallbacteria bacterium]